MLIRQTQNFELAKSIREKLKENDGYCPCAIDKNEDTKCMCKAFRDMVSGTCPCGLYVKENV